MISLGCRRFLQLFTDGFTIFRMDTDAVFVGKLRFVFRVLLMAVVVFLLRLLIAAERAVEKQTTTPLLLISLLAQIEAN